MPIETKSFSSCAASVYGDFNYLHAAQLAAFNERT